MYGCPLRWVCHNSYLSVWGITIEPFLQYERDPLLETVDDRFGLNRRSYGVNNNYTYGDLRARALSLRYRFSRETQFSAVSLENPGLEGDAYDKSVLTLSGTLGWTDDFLRPVRGLVFRPVVEQAGGFGHLVGVRGFGIEYTKVQLNVVGYLPVTPAIHLTMRLDAGRIWPAGVETVTFYNMDGPLEMDAQFAAPHEDRYDAVRFYAGGANDVRGWGTGFAGVKVNRTQYQIDENGELVIEDGITSVTSSFYEPAGGLTRLFASTELRVPVQGNWHMAAFMDVGQVSSFAAMTCPGALYQDADLKVPVDTQSDVQCGVADNGRLRWDNFKIGVGAGVRYDTPIGFMRLDLALKVNPDPLDLQTPANAFRSAQGIEEIHRSGWNRFNVHFSIGQPF